jgi:hypothetical protein
LLNVRQGQSILPRPEVPSISDFVNLTPVFQSSQRPTHLLHTPPGILHDLLKWERKKENGLPRPHIHLGRPPSLQQKTANLPVVLFRNPFLHGSEFDEGWGECSDCGGEWPTIV